jgi:hypothetical protein
LLKRTGNIFLLIAILSVTGGHWAVLQTVAWTTMLAGHMGTDSLATAFHDTFDGKHPCCLCKQIASGRKSEKKAEFTSQFKVPEFLPTTSRFVFAAPTFCWPVRPAAEMPKSISRTPPAPPPRSFA